MHICDFTILRQYDWMSKAVCVCMGIKYILPVKVEISLVVLYNKSVR
jgi:hypothetical protein